MSEGSIPDAYGWMGTGLGMIAAGLWTLTNGFLAILSPFTMAMGMLLTGFMFWMIGRAYEKETLPGGE